MAQTDQLLDLMNSYPGAFQDEQPSGDLGFGTAAVSSAERAIDIEGALDPNLRQLMSEFPSAFVDPAAIQLAAMTDQSEADATEHAAASSTAADPDVTALVNTEATAVSFVPFQRSAQPGRYAQALQRQISTMTWGQVEFYLTYEEEGLQSIWVTVGKSGTEVQSLCEAIARLINLSLAKQVPIPEIARQIRGIRGADSEGLGPNRFLGLADLIGKVLQEAPTDLIPNRPEDVPTNPGSDTKNDTDHSHASTDALSTSAWTELTDHDHEASVCPECGSELHQVNGCSGGACVVCGYSSCS